MFPISISNVVHALYARPYSYRRARKMDMLLKRQIPRLSPGDIPESLLYSLVQE